MKGKNILYYSVTGHYSQYRDISNSVLPSYLQTKVEVEVSEAFINFNRIKFSFPADDFYQDNANNQTPLSSVFELS